MNNSSNATCRGSNVIARCNININVTWFFSYAIFFRVILNSLWSPANRVGHLSFMWFEITPKTACVFTSFLNSSNNLSVEIKNQSNSVPNLHEVIYARNVSVWCQCHSYNYVSTVVQFCILCRFCCKYSWLISKERVIDITA